MICPNCGVQNSEDSTFCQHCGASLAQQSESDMQNSQPIQETQFSQPQQVYQQVYQQNFSQQQFVSQNSATEYAGFWRRLLARIIDGLIIGIVIGIPSFIVYFLVIGSVPINPEGAVNQEMINELNSELFIKLFFTNIILGLITFIASWLYYAIMESSSNQATLGKMAIGIKVTSLNRDRITFGRATGRFFSKIISGIILNIGYIMAGFTEKKQALHDMIAGTLVVKK